MTDGSTPGAAMAAPSPRDPAQVRNVVLVGPAGAGKTTVVEALLARTGVVARAGGVRAGTTVTDAEAVEHRLQRSVLLSLASLEHVGVKVNLLDAPGTADLVGELRAGLRAADSALFVVSAVGGVDALTVQFWRECEALGLPRAIVVTQLDRPRADFDESVVLCQRLLGEGVHPLYLPLHGEQDEIAGLMGLIGQRVHDWSTGDRIERDPDPQHLPLIENARADLIEAVIADSEDETLLDRYLAGEALDQDVVVADLETAVARGLLHPILPMAPLAAVGTDELLELITAGLPSPLEHPCPVVSRPDGSPAPPISCNPDGPLVAEIVRTGTDQHAGRVSLVRVLSGTLRPDTVVHVAGHDRPDALADERIGAIYAPLGARLRPVAQCPAGDLCAVTRLTVAETTDTLSGLDDPLLVEPWRLPDPQHIVAVVAGPGDEGRLGAALVRLAAEDVAVRYERSTETGQHLLWCVGDLHADVLLDRLATRYAIAVTTVPVRVALIHAGADVLEPVSAIQVRAPSSYAGSVRSDLAGRRARITGSESLDDDWSVISADVPDLELLAYAAALRALTHGTGSFSRLPLRHEPMPPQVIPPS